MFRKALFAPIAICVTLAAATPANAEPVNLYAAGSIKIALSDVATACGTATGHEVATVFGPSGTMHERIESGEPAHAFASANMAHPRKLEADRKGRAVRRFVRNKPCAIAQPSVDVATASPLEVISRPDVRLGTSRQSSDPAGDYAWELFDKAEAVRPGSWALLEGKALQLTGGPTSEQPPGHAIPTPASWPPAGRTCS